MTRSSSLCHRTARNYNVWRFSGTQTPFDIPTTAASSLMRLGNPAPSQYNNNNKNNNNNNKKLIIRVLLLLIIIIIIIIIIMFYYNFDKRNN